MKYVLYVLCAFVAIDMLVAIPLSQIDSVHAQEGVTHPTGCPYADSVPMDLCPKFAPHTETPAPAPIVLDEPVINWSAAK